MQELFTTREAAARGLTRAQLRTGEKAGRWRRIIRGVYGIGAEPPTALDRARASVLAAPGGIASGTLAGVLLELDGVDLRRVDVAIAPGGSARRTETRRRLLSPERVILVAGVACTNGLQTVLDLAPLLDDLRWEQVLECVLRKRIATLDAIEHELDVTKVRGAARIRRVLALRPAGGPPTESLLESLMVQLARRVPGLPPPVRQYEVFDANGQLVARVDLAWPDLGLFIELDGEQHKGQPVYDASRETAVVAATGWLCGRFTWTEVARVPASTARRLAAIVEQCRRRPFAA